VLTGSNLVHVGLVVLFRISPSYASSLQMAAKGPEPRMHGFARK
jgi:hypothetical protein